jgi:AcrR family transcriptional regulator
MWRDPEMQAEGRAESARAARRADVSMRVEVATLEQCLERGIGAVTVEEVAAASGISRRTFYRYFDTIDDVLCAMPRRSLTRILANFGARPLSEGLIEAYIHVFGNIQISDEERTIHRLAVEVARRWPEGWWRAMNRMRPSAHEVYSQMIARRLKDEGKDPASAGLIAAVMQAVIEYVAEENIRSGGQMPSPEQLNTALISLAGIMKDGVPS